MTDKQVQADLNKLVRLCNKLVEEAHRRHGPSGNLFYEAEGSFYLMRGDVNGSNMEHQQFIELASEGYCRLGAGAW